MTDYGYLSITNLPRPAALEKMSQSDLETLMSRLDGCPDVSSRTATRFNELTKSMPIYGQYRTMVSKHMDENP